MTLSVPRLLGASALLAVFFVLGWATSLLGAGPKPKPYACYFPSQAKVEPIDGITIKTQFDTQQVKIERIVMFCLPADKTLPPDKKPEKVMKGDHLVEYEISGQTTKTRNVIATDQFDARRLTLKGEAHWLLEPADKTPAPKEPPPKEGKGAP